MKGKLQIGPSEFEIDIPFRLEDPRARARIYTCPCCWTIWATLHFPVRWGHWSFYICCEGCNQTLEGQAPGSLFLTQTPYCEEYDEELIAALPLALHLRELDIYERHIRNELSSSRSLSYPTDRVLSA